ncbi:hypothetical protein [Mycobacterium paraterrae]|uniref:Uncharacterized protein n=1 Tax=Mycobacterium paraterrae TaxID=577492 RepID=A0ABY3VMI7_9MYCO|nr:hypothetical protein [Mycobacterium paraterrae]UMB70646.1 hypothetical protein MKK62_04855 [Mycobacterium paraterrae]
MREPESSSYEDLLPALALLDVARAVRVDRPTDAAIANACNAFEAHEVQQGAHRPTARARLVEVAM